MLGVTPFKNRILFKKDRKNNSNELFSTMNRHTNISLCFQKSDEKKNRVKTKFK